MLTEQSIPPPNKDVDEHGGAGGMGDVEPGGDIVLDLMTLLLVVLVLVLVIVL